MLVGHVSCRRCATIGPPLSLCSPCVPQESFAPVQAWEEASPQPAASKPSVTEINCLASMQDSCDVLRTRTVVHQHSLGCSLLCDTRLLQGLGGLWGCLPSRERDGEGGRRRWERGLVPGSPGSLCVLANRALLSGS